MRAQARVVGNTTGLEYGTLDQWQWQAVSYIKDNSLLCIRNALAICLVAQ